MKNNLVLCFDIGGLGLKISIYDLEINEKYSKHVTYKLLDKKEIFKLIEETFVDLSKKFKISAIAISSSGIIDSKNKLMYSLKDSKSKLIEDDLKKFMSWCPVEWFIENDANCALLAEKYFGAAKDFQNICLLTVGTALGGALMIENKIYVGSHFMANEIGCGILEEEKDFQNISIKTGMNGMVDEYNKKNSSKLTGKEIVELAMQDSESIAYQIMKKRIKNIAKVLVNMYFTIDPQLILIGGGISANDWFLNELVKFVKEYETLVGIPILAEIKPCKFRNDAGKIGALTLYLKSKKEKFNE